MKVSSESYWRPGHIGGWCWAPFPFRVVVSRVVEAGTLPVTSKIRSELSVRKPLSCHDCQGAQAERRRKVRWPARARTGWFVDGRKRAVSLEFPASGFVAGGGEHALSGGDVGSRATVVNAGARVNAGWDVRGWARFRP